MRWRRRRPPATGELAGTVLRDPRIHLAPVEIRHEIKHVYEPRPRPEGVKLMFETDGRLYVAWWPNLTFDHELDVPSVLMPPGAPPIRLRLLPEYPRGR